MSASDIQRRRPGKPKPKKPDPMNVRPAADAHHPLPTNQRPGDRRLTDALERAVTDLNKVTAGIAATLDRIREAQTGHPGAAAYDTAKVAGGGTSDPTSAAATRHDPARADETRLLRCLSAATAAIEESTRIASAWAPRAARAEQRRQATSDNQRWCEPCARITNPITKQPRREWPHTDLTTTVGGRLHTPCYLCAACYAAVIRTDHIPTGPRLPTVEELERRYDTGKTTRHHA